MRETFVFIFGLFLLVSLGVMLHTHDPAREPQRMLLSGLPAWGPSAWADEAGEMVPAGCGPDAARLLLLYCDLRFGYSFVREDPDGALRELRRFMGTITVEWQGVRQGLTFPWAFTDGLMAFLWARYPEKVFVRSFFRTPSEVFFRVVRLIQSGTLPVILFNWQGQGGLFPNHYALVVGYSLPSWELVVNPGWNYEFQLLSFLDDRITPVQIFWLEFPYLSAPQGLPSEAGDFRPILRRHFEPAAATIWPRPSRRLNLGPDLALWVWD